MLRKPCEVAHRCPSSGLIWPCHPLPSPSAVLPAPLSAPTLHALFPLPGKPAPQPPIHFAWQVHSTNLNAASISCPGWGGALPDVPPKPQIQPVNCFLASCTLPPGRGASWLSCPLSPGALQGIPSLTHSMCLLSCHGRAELGLGSQWW